MFKNKEKIQKKKKKNEKEEYVSFLVLNATEELLSDLVSDIKASCQSKKTLENKTSESRSEPKTTTKTQAKNKKTKTQTKITKISSNQNIKTSNPAQNQEDEHPQLTQASLYRQMQHQSPRPMTTPSALDTTAQLQPRRDAPVKRRHEDTDYTCSSHSSRAYNAAKRGTFNEWALHENDEKLRTTEVDFPEGDHDDTATTLLEDVTA